MYCFLHGSLVGLVSDYVTYLDHQSESALQQLQTTKLMNSVGKICVSCTLLLNISSLFCLGTQPLLDVVGHLSSSLSKRTSPSLSPADINQMMEHLFASKTHHTHTPNTTHFTHTVNTTHTTPIVKAPILKASPPGTLWSHLCLLMLSNNHIIGMLYM